MNPEKRWVLIGRELYLRESWFQALERLADASVFAGTGFATKPDLAWPAK